MRELLNTLPIYIALLAALLNLVRRQWSLNLIALVFQFIFIIPSLLKLFPIQIALIQPFSGIMVSLMLFLTLNQVGGIEKIKLSRNLTPGEIFRALAGIFLLSIISFFLEDFQKDVFPTIPMEHLYISVGLMLTGIMQLGTIREPLYLAIGLLTFLSGFQLLYSALEFSYLLEALFVAVNLLLGMVGSFFIVKNAESSPK